MPKLNVQVPAENDPVYVVGEIKESPAVVFVAPVPATGPEALAI
jgi:hypothetical protein